MSFDDFLKYKGNDILNASRDEAYFYLSKHGQYTCWADWIWKTPDRDAFWKSMYWSQRAEDTELSLHSKCSAIRQAKAEWKRFQKNVTPVKKIEPTVPPLPK